MLEFLEKEKAIKKTDELLVYDKIGVYVYKAVLISSKNIVNQLRRYAKKENRVTIIIRYDRSNNGYLVFYSLKGFTPILQGVLKN